MDISKTAEPFANAVFQNMALEKLESSIVNKNNLGISQDYDRNLYDDEKSKKECVESFFDERKSNEEYYTGEKLHRSQKAAVKRYGRIASRKHIVQADHTIPLERLHKVHKMNPFLSDNDLKKIGNSKMNLRPVGARFNQMKSNSTNLEFVVKGKYKLGASGTAKVIAEQLKAGTMTQLHAATLTGKNIAGEFYKGAKESSSTAVMAMTIEGVHNLILVAQNKKDTETAAKEMARLGLRIMGNAGTKQVLNVGTEIIEKNAKNQLLKMGGEKFHKLINANHSTELMLVASIVGDAAMRLSNGEISSDEFFDEISEQGLKALVSYWGSQLMLPIPIVGAFIGSVIITNVCDLIVSYKEDSKARSNKMIRLDELTTEALSEMKYQRENLKKMIDAYFDEWDEQIGRGFRRMYEATLQDDAEGIAYGLDEVLNLLGKEVKFKSVNEYKAFILNKDAVLDL